MDLQTSRILITLTYFGIFEYPLTLDQIWKFYPVRIQNKNFFISKKLNKKFFVTKNNLVFINTKNSDQAFAKRIRNEKFSSDKIMIARNVSKYLSKIPTVYFLGVSGSLAMKNADKDDDIDIFLVTKKNSIWITRLLVMIALNILGKRRKYNDKDEKNKICLNLIMDEDKLNFNKNLQDVYIAHEIVQIISLYDKSNVYQKLFANNSWIQDYLPNIYYEIIKNNGDFIKKKSIFEDIFTSKFLNTLAKKIQLYFINKHKTNEVVTDKKLAFHPIDYRFEILKEYKKSLSSYNINYKI